MATNKDKTLEVNSPVHEHEGKWYFWDETWGNRLGPYDTRDEAADLLADYCAELDFEMENGEYSRIHPEHRLSEAEMFKKSFERPTNYFKLSASEQWAIDKDLGILDWKAEWLTYAQKVQFEHHYDKGTVPKWRE